MKKEIFFINNLEELKNFASKIVPLIKDRSSLSINGDLGVGKTTLTQLLCAELGVKERVVSPTFTVLRRYWSQKRDCYINHFDFFRVFLADDVGVFADIRDEGINIVEWAEKCPLFLREEDKITIEISFHKNGRRIEVLSAI